MQLRIIGAALIATGLWWAAAPPALAAGAASAATGTAAKPAREAPIDINSASLSRLKTLPGIGDAEAARIVAGRPYRSKADLVTQAGIPAGVYQSIRHRIIAVQPRTTGREPRR